MNATYIVKDVYEYEIIKDKIIEWIDNNLDSYILVKITDDNNSEYYTSNLRDNYSQFKNIIEENITKILSDDNSIVAIQIDSNYLFILVAYDEIKVSMLFKKIEETENC